jgi:hypothetical protein
MYHWSTQSLDNSIGIMIQVYKEAFKARATSGPYKRVSIIRYFLLYLH